MTTLNAPALFAQSATSLLDLLDDWTEQAIEWEPIYYRFTLVDLVRAQLCRDCGTKVNWVNCGGSRWQGAFQLCDACASLDGCLTRQHNRGEGWHLSTWAVGAHQVHEHDELTRAQERRRAKYRAKRPARTLEGAS
ncbi:hypothetical protein ACIPY5_19750 [Microbacterium sp. NPDC089698]|uniref:hypothetical protein n=1 Tax=Microbacterium sp. NPDC089698 TaxID=3364200 RepID=UPI0037FB33DD